MKTGKCAGARISLMLGVAVGATALQATPAAGQSEAAAVRSDEADTDDSVIVVTATGRSSAVSTTKTAAPIIELPQSVSIISKEEMDLRGATTVNDALAYTAGVQVSTLGTDSRTESISVRGFGAGGFSSNNNFLDGLRLATGGQFTRTSTDPFSLEQIEVLKGPSGALYGQTAPGGVINFVTKRPTDRFQAEFMLQAIGTTDLDNWNYQAAADVSGPLTSNLSGRLVGLARTGDTLIDDVETSRYYISPSLTWRPGEHTSWTIIGQYQRDEGGSTFQFLPAQGSLFPTNGGFIENGANLGDPTFNTYDRDQILISSFFEHRFGDVFTFRNNSRYSHLYSDSEGLQNRGGPLATCPATIPGCIPGQTMHRRGSKSNGTSDGLATDTQLEARFTTGAIKHTLLAGFDYFRSEYDFIRYAVDNAVVLPVLDILDPEYTGTEGYDENLIVQTDSAGVSEQWGVYLQDQIAIDRLRLTIGGRQDWAEDRSQVFNLNTDYTTKANAFTWRVGAVYLFDNGLAPYASYAESFQPETGDPSSSLTGEPFVPTTGQQYEVGLRYQRGNNIYVTLGAYQITQQNVTTPDPAGTLCGPTAICLIQAGETRVRGIELEGRASLPSGTTVIANLTRSEAEVTESGDIAVGNAVAQSPDWFGSFFVSQRLKNGPLEGLSFGGGVRYTGKGFGDSGNTIRLPDYTLFDLFLRYDLGRASSSLQGASFSINATNVTDKVYVPSCGSLSSCHYGDGRSVTARLQFRW